MSAPTYRGPSQRRPGVTGGQVTPVTQPPGIMAGVTGPTYPIDSGAGVWARSLPPLPPDRPLPRPWRPPGAHPGAGEPGAPGAGAELSPAMRAGGGAPRHNSRASRLPGAHSPRAMSPHGRASQGRGNHDSAPKQGPKTRLDGAQAQPLRAPDDHCQARPSAQCAEFSHHTPGKTRMNWNRKPARNPFKTSVGWAM